MNNYDSSYISILNDVLTNGSRKNDRTGVGTYSLFGKQLRVNMQEGFPLLTTKKMHTKSIVHELLWFLKGGDNIKYLVDNGVNIWNEWPYKNYCSYDNEGDRLTMEEFITNIKNDDAFAKKWGGLGPVYGKQWVEWLDCLGDPINQVQNIINDLKINPDSRRMLVNAWNVAEVPAMVLPCCHYAWQVWTKELMAWERKAWYNKHGAYGTGAMKFVALLLSLSEDVQQDKKENESAHKFYDGEGVPRRAISLMFQIRSVDLGLGAPFDIASYGILLSMLAQCTNMVPEELIMSSGDTHIYTNHVAALQEQMKRQSFPLPKLRLNPDVKDIFAFTYDDIKFLDYESHPAVKMDVAV